MSLSDFVMSVKISARSPIRDRQKLKLTALSIAIFAAASQQTAGFAMVLLFGFHSKLTFRHKVERLVDACGVYP
jgi:hypothetical protein